jgi:hypothetical protein
MASGLVMFMVREVPIISVGSDNRWMTLVLILDSNILEII